MKTPFSYFSLSSLFLLLSHTTTGPVQCMHINKPWNPESFYHMTQKFTSQPFTIHEHYSTVSLLLESSINLSQIEANQWASYFYYTNANQYIELEMIQPWNRLNTKVHQHLVHVCESMIEYRTDTIPLDLHADFSNRNHEEQNREKMPKESTLGSWLIPINQPFSYFLSDSLSKVDLEIQESNQYNREKYLLHLCSYELNNFSTLTYDPSTGHLQYKYIQPIHLEVIIQNILAFSRENDGTSKIPKSILWEKAKYLGILLIQYEKLIFEIFSSEESLGIYSLPEYRRKIINRLTIYSNTILHGLQNMPLSQIQESKNAMYLQESERLWKYRKQVEMNAARVHHLEWSVSWIPLTSTIYSTVNSVIMEPVQWLSEWFQICLQKITYVAFYYILYFGSIAFTLYHVYCKCRGLMYTKYGK
jgi:hypothetical protein